MNEQVLSVTDVNRYIKDLFTIDGFLNNVTVKGEISNLKIHGRGHLYFSLKDENSKINCVMFNYAPKVTFELNDGMSVQVKGRVNVYEASGSYQIYVNQMTNDGVGNLYQLFEELKKRLNNEGLFDETHKQKLPRIPKKIGVITAPTGAAVKDIISTINKRYPLCEILIFPTLVQGDGAKENIVKMIEKANETDVDLIILGRGGGSIEDLWAFNEEIVARSIYNSKIPIISAVGHEIDFTISDFVADLRAPTPTGAALMAVPDQYEIMRYLSEYKGRITNVLNNKLKRANEKLSSTANSFILKNILSLYSPKEQKLDILIDKLNGLINNKISYNTNKLNQLLIKIKGLSPSEKIDYNIEKIKQLEKILNNSMNNIIKFKSKELTNSQTKIELLNPTNILDKGYSIIKINDKIIKSKNDVKISDNLDIILKDGIINSEVKGVK